MTLHDDHSVEAHAYTVSPRRRALMLGSIVALNMLALAATDLYLPSVPALPEILCISLESAQMTLVAFAAGFAISQIFMGAFGDIYSRRAVLGTSVALFVPATIACAMAQSADATGKIADVSTADQTIKLSDGKVYVTPAEFNFEGLEKNVEVVIFYTVVDGKRMINDLEVVQ